MYIKTIILDNPEINFSNGATKEKAREILRGLKGDFGYREFEILSNLKSIEQNTDVPQDYTIYGFYDKNGDGFEAGKTPSGYSITC